MVSSVTVFYGSLLRHLLPSQFTTIAASLGLKTTRDKLREDFEEVGTSPVVNRSRFLMSKASSLVVIFWQSREG